MTRKKILIISIIVVVLFVSSGVTFLVIKNRNTLDRIVIESFPYKTTYYVEEELLLDGLQVTSYTRGGKGTKINHNDLEIVGFDNSVASDSLNIVVKYRGKEASFQVIIENRPEMTPYIIGIEMNTQPTKTIYYIGDEIDLRGASIKILYSNDKHKVLNIIKSYVYGFDSSLPNEELVITINYIDYETGNTFQTNFTVAVVQ